MKFLFSLSLLCLMAPCSLCADTIYTYTGNPYANCEGVYYCPGTNALAISITFDTPYDQTFNLENFGFGTVPVSSFSITDGTGLYITGANTAFEIGTGPTGNIISWSIMVDAYELYPPPLGELQLSSQSFLGSSIDESSVLFFDQDSLFAPPFERVGLAFISGNPGVWSSSSTPFLESSTSTPILESFTSTPIPEPSTLLLLGSLLGSLVLWAGGSQGRQSSRR